LGFGIWDLGFEFQRIEGDDECFEGRPDSSSPSIRWNSFSLPVGARNSASNSLCSLRLSTIRELRYEPENQASHNKDNPVRMRLVYLTILLFSIYATPAHAASLESQLRSLIEPHPGTVAVAIRNLTTGEEFLHNADLPMPTASLIKFPVMVEAYRQAKSGTVDLQELTKLSAGDAP